MGLFAIDLSNVFGGLKFGTNKQSRQQEVQKEVSMITENNDSTPSDKTTVEIVNGIKVYNLSESAYNYYITHVKGNENVDFETAKRKLTRNTKLGMKLRKGEDSSKHLYLYGQLQILVVDGNKIVWLRNDKKQCKFQKDMDKFDELNKQLDIKR